MAKWGTDEGKFISIFTLRSRPQLGATFPEYEKVSNIQREAKIVDLM